MLRPSAACALLLLGATLPASTLPAQAVNLPASVARPADAVVNVGSRAYRPRRQKDCVPTNGPFGFYGNIWCEPPIVAQYNRNLGAGWPMKTPPSLRQPKPSSNYAW